MSAPTLPNTRPRHPHIITLGVQDLLRSEQFYREGFHWPLADSISSENIRFFDLGGLLVSLYPLSQLKEEVGQAADSNGFQGISLAHNVGSEAEADQLIARLAALGASMLQPAQKVFWGGYSGYIADPDGHIWEIAFNPYLSFGEDGRLAPLSPAGED